MDGLTEGLKSRVLANKIIRVEKKARSPQNPLHVG